MLRLQPKNTDALGARAQAYYKKGKLALALADCQKALQLDTRFGQAWKIRGAIYSRQEKFADALKEFRQAEQYHYPFIDEDCFDYGYTNLQLKNYEAAAECFKSAVRVNEVNLAIVTINYRHSDQVYRAWSHLGIVYEKLEKPSDANYYLAQAIKLDPKNHAAYLVRADIAWRAKQYQQAADDYSQVVHLRPQNALAWKNLGMSQHHLGYHEDAIKCSREALRLNPKLNEARFNLGLIFASQGDWEKAKIEYEEALKAATKDELQTAMSDINEALKKQPDVNALNEAVKILQAAVK